MGGDNTHRQLGIPQGDGGCWDHPGERVREAAGVLGGAPRKEAPGQGQLGQGEPLLNADPLRPYSERVPPLGPPQMSQRVEGYPDTKALVGAGGCVLSGFGFLGLKPVK